MATIGSAKATLVNKIDALTTGATAKDTIYLAKALKENSSLNNFVWQGAWTNSTVYGLDDVVSTSGKTYICILGYTSAASPGAFAVGSNWSLMAEKGTDGTNGTNGTDLTTTLSTAGDIVYKGASALTRLAKGTADQVLTMNTGATAPVWATAGGGGKVLQVVSSAFASGTSTASTSYVTTGHTASITPQSGSKVLVLYNGGGAYLPTSASSFYGTIYRGSTDLSSSSYGLEGFYCAGAVLIAPQSMNILDTSVGGDGATSITYELYIKAAGGTVFLASDRGASVMTLIEIGA